MVSKKDNLFAASRFVLPEHRELYLELKREQTLVQQPVLEEDELMEIHYRIQDSQQYDYAVTVRWWEPVKNGLGEFRELWGWVQQIDSVGKRLKLVNDETMEWIDVNGIVGVWRR